MSAFRRRLKSFSSTARSKKQRRRQNKRLAFEECELRRLLATFTVTSSLDTGAVGELRWAVNSANMNPGPDLVNFQVGNVALTQGELTITDPVKIDGSSVLPVLVDISAAANSRIFRVDDSNPNTSIPVEMVQLQLRGGDVSGFNNGQGGAILNHERLDFNLGLISSNRAKEGAGIANRGYLGMTGSTLSDGKATRDGGGGLYNAPTSVAVISGSSILGNDAEIGSGGGILNVSAEVTVGGDSLVQGNSAAVLGGGIAVRQAPSGVVSGSLVTIDAATVSFNSAPVGGGVSVDGIGSTLETSAGALIASNDATQGGGIAVLNRGDVWVRGSVVSGNLAHTQGGGLWAEGLTSVQLRGAQVLSNQAGSAFLSGRGAGIFADGGAVIDVDNSIISYNGALDTFTGVDQGGGVFAGNAVDLSINNSTLSGNVAGSGGGLFATTANNGPRTQVSVTYSTLSGNVSYGAGAGLHAGPGTDLYVKCSTINNNLVTAGRGGGLYLQGEPTPRRVVAEIRDATIAGNSAYSDGGGIASIGGVALTMSNSIVSENETARNGGGIYVSGAQNADAAVNEVTIDLSLISGNVAGVSGGPILVDASGGGLWAGNRALVDVSATTFESNRANSRGGGMALQELGRFDLRDSTVSGNVSENGGGASVVRSNATFLQTTFYANRARSHGGGFYIESTLPNVVDIDHSTISLNSASLSGAGFGTGGGIYAGNTAAVYALRVNLNHTIVSTNLGAPLGGFDEVYDGGTPTGNPLVTARFSLLRDNSNTSFAPGNPDANGNKIGTPALPIDAMLQPLGGNGGPTLTMLPSNASPAINAGDPLFTGPPNGDQRQLPFKRVALGQVDMGSVEVQPAPPTPDFNNDGVADCTDIDALSAVVVAGSNNPAFDLNGDGLVNRADVEKWLDDAPDVNGLAITRYLPGDINLDTVVDGADFIIWNANKFTINSAWCAGDLTTDGSIDGQDFLIWNAFKFRSSPVPTGCGLFRDGPSLTREDGGGESPLDQVFADEQQVVDRALSDWNAASLTAENAVELVSEKPIVPLPVPTFHSVDLADDDADQEEHRDLVFALA